MTAAAEPQIADSGGDLSFSEIQAVGLVTAAHFMSHFYQLVLPPVFGMMAARHGVGFTELGIVVSVFAISTTIAQTPAGFLVDRLSAPRILALGLGLLGASVALYGLASTYWMLLPLAAIGGMANAVFHPADYAILSARVQDKRIGRAFSLHAVSGNLGWAAAPAAMLGITALANLTVAFMAVGIFGMLLAAYLFIIAGKLETGASEEAAVAVVTETSTEAIEPKGGAVSDGISLLLSRPVLMLFFFQFIYAMAFGGVRNFSVVALPAIWDLTAEAVAGALTGYLIAASCGNMVGGYLADRTGRPGTVFTISILIITALVASLASIPMTIGILTGVLLVAGALQGSLMPARDMLVRQIAPKGQMGKLFGFTSSGLALGNAVTPTAFGWVMDNADPRIIFYASAGCMLLALLTYVETRRQAQ